MFAWMTQSITVNDLCSSPAGHLEIFSLITPNDDDDTMDGLGARKTSLWDIPPGSAYNSLRLTELISRNALAKVGSTAQPAT